MSCLNGDHYWIIESNEGLESKGVCRKCGDKKMFPNIIQPSMSDIKPYDSRIFAGHKTSTPDEWKRWAKTAYAGI